MTTEPSLHLYLIGDSDIERWPASLLPTPTVADNQNVARQDRGSSPPPPTVTVTVTGRNGATLPEVAAMARSTLPRMSSSLSASEHGRQRGGTAVHQPVMVEVVVACAGENDIGGGKSVEATVDGFRYFLDAALPTTTGEPPERAGRRRFLLFLGPKLEPWLTDDFPSRKKYVKLSRAMRRACERHAASDRIVFLDCMTLFCGETASLPGALSGGRASPEDRFFCGDGLHLSDEGYRVWKGLVEDSIRALGLANLSEDATIKVNE